VQQKDVRENLLIIYLCQPFFTPRNYFGDATTLEEDRKLRTSQPAPLSFDSRAAGETNYDMVVSNFC
jgi:hypothetical protein